MSQMRRPPPSISLQTAVIALLLSADPRHVFVHAQDFNVCQKRVEQIWNGTNFFDYTPEQISRFLYRGDVVGMKPGSNRSQFMTLTTEGWFPHFSLAKLRYS